LTSFDAAEVAVFFEAAFSATTRVDLRFDDDHLVAGLLDQLSRLVFSGRGLEHHDVLRNRNAVGLEQLFGLILVNLH
jgi:hypothetical protein